MIAEELLVRFGGLEMQSADPFHNGLTLTEIEGWNDAVDGKFQEVDIEGGDGSFEVPVDRSSRTVTVKGYCRADTYGDLKQWQERVTAQIGGPSARQFYVDELGETEWAPAQCVRAKFPIFGGQTFADFSMTFWMPKPWKFGETLPFLNGEPASHAGNTGSVPFFRIGGTRPGGYTIAGPGGRSLTVSLPVIPSAPHEYDMSTGELTVGGVFVDGGITGPGDSWAVPGGGLWAHTISGPTADFTTLLRKVSI